MGEAVMVHHGAEGGCRHGTPGGRGGLHEVFNELSLGYLCERGLIGGLVGVPAAYRLVQAHTPPALALCHPQVGSSRLSVHCLARHVLDHCSVLLLAPCA